MSKKEKEGHMQSHCLDPAESIAFPALENLRPEKEMFREHN